MALAKLNRLELLAKLYREVRIPRAVYREVVTQGLELGAADARTVQLFLQQQEWPIIDVSAALRLPAGIVEGQIRVIILCDGAEGDEQWRGYQGEMLSVVVF